MRGPWYSYTWTNIRCSLICCVAWFAFSWCNKHPDQRQPKEERVYLTYSNHDLLGQELKQQRRPEETEGNLLTGLLLRFKFNCLAYTSQDHLPRAALLIKGWVLPHQSWIKKMEAFSQLRPPLPRWSWFMSTWQKEKLTSTMWILIVSRILRNLILYFQIGFLA